MPTPDVLKITLDGLLHVPARVSIVSYLQTTGERTFSSIQNQLEMTEGNLMSHLRTLRRCGVVVLTKTGAGRNSVTHVTLTDIGRMRLKAYGETLEHFGELLQEGRGINARMDYVRRKPHANSIRG